MNRTDVQGTLREMWETRPARPRRDRQVAGVASAIAHRYDIDPTLVRIGFVVAAFTGIGAALYLAGWAVLPEQPGDPAQRSRPRPIILVGLVIATIVSFGMLFGGGRHGGGLLAGLVVLGLLFLLHRSRSERGLAAAARPGGAVGGTGPATGGTEGVSLRKEPDGQPAQTPPSWDPLGAAPFAWDLPEPSGPLPPPAPRKPPVTAVTLGLALLAGAVTAGILLLAGSFTLATVPIVLGVGLTVLGLGLVAGAFLRTGRGLIPFALLGIVLTWGVLAAPVDRWRDGEVGDVRIAPASAAELAPRYERPAGAIDLDLRNLDLSVPQGGTDPGPVRTAVSIGAGEIQVRLPENADVTVRQSVGVGSVSYGDRQEDGGPGAELRIDQDLGADGVRSGRLLVLDLEAGAGNVEVNRG